MLKAAINTQPDISRTIFTDAVMKELRKLVDVSVNIGEPLTEGRLIQRCQGVDIILTTWGALPITGRVLAACPKLKFVAHAAGSVKSVVTESLAQMDIPVSSAAVPNGLPVARYTLGLILCALRQAFSWRETFRKESVLHWWDYCMNGVDGYTNAKIGLFGVGKISLQLMVLLKPFDFDTYVVSSHFTAKDCTRYGVKKAELDWIMEHCEVISLHAAEIPRNHHAINARRLALMRDGAHLINTARGNLIDETALYKALKSGRIHAYLDVLEEEPPPENHPLLTLPNCHITPHIAGSGGREKEQLGFFAVSEIERFIEGKPLQGLVDISNLEKIA